MLIYLFIHTHQTTLLDIESVHDHGCIIEIFGTILCIELIGKAVKSCHRYDPVATRMPFQPLDAKYRF